MRKTRRVDLQVIIGNGGVAELVEGGGLENVPTEAFRGANVGNFIAISVQPQCMVLDTTVSYSLRGFKTSRLTARLQSRLACFSDPYHDAPYGTQRVFISNNFHNLAAS
jgi:hypothetical protein